MFTPVNEVERKLIDAATRPEARSVFVATMLESMLYLCPAGDPAVNNGLDQLIVSGPGTPDEAVVAFTSPERVREVVGPDARMHGMTGRDVLEMLRGKTLHLNVNLVPGVRWSAEDIDSILDGGRAEITKADEQVLLGHPSDPPTEMIAALGKTLGAVPGVKGAWLMLAHRSSEPEPSWMLGVETDGLWDDVRTAIGAALPGVDMKNRELQATKVEDVGFGASLREGIVVVAPKKKGLKGFFGR